MTEVVREGVVTWVNKNTVKCTWAGLDGDDSGQAIDLSGFPDREVQVYGTFDSATTTLYGSSDERVKTDRAAGTLFGSKTASWNIVKDNLDNNIAKAAAGQDIIIDNNQFFAPVNTGGGGSTSLTVVITATRSRI